MANEKLYESPLIEIIEVRVEHGFNASSESLGEEEIL